MTCGCLKIDKGNQKRWMSSSENMWARSNAGLFPLHDIKWVLKWKLKYDLSEKFWQEKRINYVTVIEGQTFCYKQTLNDPSMW